MKRISLLVAAMFLAAGADFGAVQASNLDTGGAFKKSRPKQQKPQKSYKPAPKVSYDGTYAISGVRTLKAGKVFCFETYNATITVRNGQASHQLPFGHTLYGNTSGNRLRIASQREASGGRWAGSISLPRPGGVGRGTLNWSGDGSRCNFTLSVTRR